MRLLSSVAVAVLCIWPPASNGQPVPRGSAELVRELYRQYAWEAAEQPLSSRRTFIDAPREKLLEFLEPSLVEMLRKDRECVERTREICKLSFAPLWDSQDPGAKNLRVLIVPGASRVRVQFNYPSNDQLIVLHFRLVPTPSGPRIADIEYKRGHTLRKALGASP